jgi:hypothetical protein
MASAYTTAAQGVNTYLAICHASLISSNTLFRRMSPSLAGSLHDGHRLISGNASRMHCNRDQGQRASSLCHCGPMALTLEQKEWPHAMETGEAYALLQMGHSVAASRRTRFKL